MKKISLFLMAFFICAWFPQAYAMGTAGFIMPTRYYDAPQGRFISADTVVPNPNDPQSLNRYAYVRNNPIGLTDPSGHSWLSKTVNKVNSWADKNPWGAFAVQQFSSIAGTALLTRTETGRNILAGEIIIGTAVGTAGIGGPVWSGALSGELVGGYSAYKSGGSILSGVVVGGAVGAGTGYLSQTIGTTSLPDTGGAWRVVDGKAVQVLAEPNLAALQSAGQGAFAQMGARVIGQGAVNGAGIGAISAYAGGRGSSNDIISGAYRGAARGAALSAAAFAASSAFSNPSFPPRVTGQVNTHLSEGSDFVVSTALQGTVNQGLTSYSYTGTMYLTQSQNVLSMSMIDSQISINAAPTVLYWLAQ